jgi:crotonobetainyl-CoA:carnitine CoA-transferase CaiB-like acyl-CoA transferase
VGPLDDLRVIDLTVARAGPTAVRQLADWGADVIRVEPPTPPGSEADRLFTARHGPDFQNLHRNKRAISLDLKSEEGHDLLVRMVEDADVVVENWRPEVKHRLRVDYDTLRAVNPRLVYASISGFGQDGPYGGRGGVDQIAQGLGGLMSITGLPGQGPVRVGVPISDLAAGVYLALGIMIALHERERTGQGQWVHTSLLEAMVAMLDFQAARWTMCGEVAEQAGNDHPTMIPMGTFRTADGHVNIAGPAGRLWPAFCRATGLDELLADPDYATSPQRSQRRQQLNARIAEVLGAQTTAHWVEVLNQAGVPCGPVNSIDQTFADPQVRHLGLAVGVEHPALGSVDIVRNALNLSGTPDRPGRAAPESGQHTDEVLAELGLGAEQVADLRARGVV